MQKFRKKPVVIDAIRISDENIGALADIGNLPDSPVKVYSMTDDGSLAFVAIETLEGTMHGSPGDWLIRGIKGEYYPCAPDIFEATYEPVEG